MTELTPENKKRNNKILALLFIGVLMGALDISIVGPAIPSIENTIRVEPRLLGWIFSIYVLFQLTGIGLFAKLSDIFGRRNIYIIAVSIFAVGSLVVVVSHNFPILLIGRAIQGFGSSGIFPVALATVGDIFPPDKRGAALGMIGAVFGLAFVIGPVLAGTLLAFFPWNSLFLINLPIAALLVFGSLKLLPSARMVTNKKLDIAGILLLGLLLASFAFGINNIDSHNFASSLMQPRSFTFILLSLLLLPVFVFVERKAQSPVVKLGMFYSRQIRVVGLIAIGTGIFQSSVVFIPNFAVGMFGIDPSKASFMLLPIVLATAIGSPLAGRMLDKTGSKVIIICGLIISSMAIFSFSALGDSYIHFYITGALLGFGTAMLMGPPLRYIMLNEVAPADRALTQGILTIFISIGQITGSALVSAVIASGGHGVAGYKTAFLYLGFMIIFLLLSALFLRSRAKEKEFINRIFSASQSS